MEMNLNSNEAQVKRILIQTKQKSNKSYFKRSTSQLSLNSNEFLKKRTLMEMNLNLNQAQVKRILIRTNHRSNES